MSYPLTLRFKIIAIAQQLSVTDNAGRMLMYVKQKAFKLREAITIFGDEKQTIPLYRIQADRVLDFSARYAVSTNDGREIGAVKQRGMRSIWRARYDIFRGDDVVFTVQEENPFAKVADSFLGQIPILGMFAGYLFHPKYLVSTADGRPAARATKQPAMFEGVFRVDRLETPLTPEDERLLLIGTMTTALLERTRG